MKKLTQAEYLPIDKLKPFEGHPFYVKEDDDMEQLTESIRQQGKSDPVRENEIRPCHSRKRPQSIHIDWDIGHCKRNTPHHQKCAGLPCWPQRLLAEA